MVIVAKILTWIVLIVLGGVIYSLIKYFRKGEYISIRESLDLTELPIITFHQGDIKLNFLLDTGSCANVLDMRVAANLDGEMTEKIYDVKGIGGSLSDIHSAIVTIQYKDKTFKEEFQITDMSETFDNFKKLKGVSIHGILGGAFFIKYKYVLDYNEMVAYANK